MRRIAPLACLLALALALPARAEDPEPQGPSDEERAEIRRLVDELRDEASRLRGLPWKEEVPADLLSRDQLRDNMAKSMREEIPPEELERDVRIARRLGLLAPDLRARLTTVAGSPRLTRHFESSVPGLFFIGLPAAHTFGPVMRFVCGTGFAARRVAARVAALGRA